MRKKDRRMGKEQEEEKGEEFPPFLMTELSLSALFHM